MFGCVVRLLCSEIKKRTRTLLEARVINQTRTIINLISFLSQEQAVLNKPACEGIHQQETK